MMSMHKLSKTALLFIIAILAILAFASLGISLVPYESIKPSVDALAPDGRNNLFTSEFFERIVVRSQLAAGCLLLAGGLLYAFRERVSGLVSNALIDCSSSAAELTHRFNQALRKENKTHLFALLIILLVAVVVRLSFLFQPMRYDEAFTFLEYASPSLLVGLSYYSAPNNHLFHTFLVHIAYSLLGDQPWVLRLPALLAGILMVPASYLAIRLLYDKHAALLTAGFVASSSILIEFSTNARGYTLMCLIFMLILALGAYLIKEKNNSVAWLLFTILSALGFYTIPIMLYPFGIALMWLLLSAALQPTKLCRWSLLKSLCASTIIAGALTVALYSPVFVVSGMEAVTSNHFVKPQTWTYFISESLPLLHATWKQWNRDIPFVIKALLVIGFIASLIFHRRLTRYRVPVALAVCAWLVPVLLIQQVVPGPRMWLFLLPLYLGLASAGVSYVLLRPVELRMSSYQSVPSAALAVMLSVWLGLNVVQSQSVNRTGEAEGLGNAEAVTLFLKDYLQENDRVLAVIPASAPLGYYFKLHNVPVRYFWSPTEAASKQRLILVVNESDAETSESKSEKQSIEDVLGRKGLSGTNLGAPKLVRRFGSSSLYEISRSE